VIPGENLLLHITSVDKVECAHGLLEGEVSIELSNFKMKVMYSGENNQKKEIKFLTKYFSVPLHYIYRLEKKSHHPDKGIISRNFSAEFYTKDYR